MGKEGRGGIVGGGLGIWGFGDRVRGLSETILSWDGRSELSCRVEWSGEFATGLRQVDGMDESVVKWN